MAKVPTKVPSQVKITFRKKPTKTQIHKALEEIFKINGCLTCGFNGIISSVHFAVNPAPHVAALQKAITVGPEIDATVEAFEVANFSH